MQVGDRIAFDGLLLALGTLLIATFQWALMIRQDEFMSRRAVMHMDFINNQIEHTERVGQNGVTMLPLQIHNQGTKSVGDFYVIVGIPIGGPKVGSPFLPQGFNYTYGGTNYELYSETVTDHVFPGSRINFALTLLNAPADSKRYHFGWLISTEDGKFPEADKLSALYYSVVP